MIRHSEIDNATLHSLIRSRSILLAGNRKLRIYGTLHCRSGKRMKVSNRVFFASEEEALNFGFRRCKKCKADFPQITPI
jgi:methylphosphotriester-DNA--protein-cysteine methyltransferase